MAFRFEHLEIWKESITFAKETYQIVEDFPKHEFFALCDQLRRAAVSVSANIAEGSGSSSNKDFRNYLNIATKSLFEVVSLLAIAEENNYISKEQFRILYKKADNLVKRVQAFRNSLDIQ